MLGHRYTLTGNITAGSLTADEGASTQVFDANTLGTADYTEVSSYTSTAKDTTSTTTGLAGVSLGNLGVSLLVYQSSTARSIGGTSSYAWTAGTDAAYLATLLTGAGDDVTTAETLNIGYGENGAATNYGGSGTFIAKALGQYTLFGIPLIANIGMTSSSNSLGLTQVKTTYSETVAYASTAGAGTAISTDVNTYTASYGTNRTATWTMDTLAGAWAPEPGAYIDPTVSKNNGFDLNFAIGAEPVFVIDDALSFRTKALLSVLSENDTVATTLLAASTYSLATTAAENDTWAYNYSKSVSQKNGLLTLGFELGGMAELTDPSGFVTLGTGAFFQPGFGFGSTTNATETTTITRAYTDSVTVTPATLLAAQGALSLDAAALLIGEVDGYEGSSTNTSTKTYADNDTKSVIALDINLPTAVKLSFKEGKFATIFGYTLVHSSKVTTVNTAASSTAQVVTISDGAIEVFNSTNATHYPAGAELNDTATTAGTTTVTTTTQWNGQMGWCFRWMPSEALTIDLEGATIMTALNGVGLSDFNLDTLLSSLGISATFRF